MHNCIVQKYSKNSKFPSSCSYERESCYQKSSYSDLLKRLCMLCDLGNLLSCTQKKCCSRSPLSLPVVLGRRLSLFLPFPIKNNIRDIRRWCIYSMHTCPVQTMLAHEIINNGSSLLLWATYRVKWRFMWKSKKKSTENPAGQHEIVFSIIYEDIVYSFNWLPVQQKKVVFSIEHWQRTLEICCTYPFNE